MLKIVKNHIDDKLEIIIEHNDINIFNSTRLFINDNEYNKYKNIILANIKNNENIIIDKAEFGFYFVVYDRKGLILGVSKNYSNRSDLDDVLNNIKILL